MPMRRLSGIRAMELDLTTRPGREAQIANVRAFRRRKIWVLVSFASVFGVFLLASVMPDKRFETVVISLMFPAVLMCMFTLMRIRCPHCGTKPEGGDIRASAIVYKNAADLSAQCCIKCNYFLSAVALQQALDRVSVQPGADTAP